VESRSSLKKPLPLRSSPHWGWQNGRERLSRDTSSRKRTTCTGKWTPVSVLQIMVQQFRKVFLPEWSNRASDLGITEREAVILASIIEKGNLLPGGETSCFGRFP